MGHENKELQDTFANQTPIYTKPIFQEWHARSQRSHFLPRKPDAHIPMLLAAGFPRASKTVNLLKVILLKLARPARQKKPLGNRGRETSRKSMHGMDSKRTDRGKCYSLR